MANEAKIKISVNDQASKGLDSIGAKAKNMRGAFLAVGAAGAAVVASLALSVKSFAQTGDEIQKMGLRTGVSTVALSELKFALEQSGSSLEGFEKGIRRMSSFIQDGRDGLTETTRAMESLGLSVEAFDDLSPEAAFDVLTQALAGVDNKLTQAALAQDIFGRSGTALLPMLAQGADGIAKLRKEAHELGIVFDQDAADAAARLVDAQNTLRKSIDGVKFAIAETLVPSLTPLIEGFANAISKISAWAKENPVLAKTIAVLAFGVGGLTIAIAGLGLALPPVITGLGLLSGALTSTTVALGLATLGVGALTAALLLLPFVAIIAGLAAVTVWFFSLKDAAEIAAEGVKKITTEMDELIDSGAAAELGFVRLSEKISDVGEISIDAATALAEAGQSFSDLVDEIEEGRQKIASDAMIAFENARLLAANRVEIESKAAAEIAQAEADSIQERANAISDFRDKQKEIAQDTFDFRMELRENEVAEAVRLLALENEAVEATAARNAAAFAKVQAAVMLLPSQISAEGGIPAGGGDVASLFKTSQRAVEEQLAAARAQLAAGDFGGGTTAAMIQAEINRLTGVTGSEQFRGERLGELFAPPGGFGTTAPPMIPGMTMIFNGDVYGLDEFDDRVNQAIMSDEMRGIAP